MLISHFKIQSPLFMQYHHLSFTCPTTKHPSSGLPLTHHREPTFLHTRGQAIFTLLPPPEISLFSFLSPFSPPLLLHPYTLKRQENMIYPCLTPLSILKHSHLPFTLTQIKLSIYIFLIPLNSLPPTSYILSISHNVFLLTLSYIFSESINYIYNLHFYFCPFSPICFRVVI